MSSPETIYESEILRDSEEIPLRIKLYSAASEGVAKAGNRYRLEFVTFHLDRRSPRMETIAAGNDVQQGNSAAGQKAG